YEMTTWSQQNFTACASCSRFSFVRYIKKSSTHLMLFRRFQIVKGIKSVCFRNLLRLNFIESISASSDCLCLQSFNWPSGIHFFRKKSADVIFQVSFINHIAGSSISRCEDMKFTVVLG